MKHDLRVPGSHWQNWGVIGSRFALLVILIAVKALFDSRFGEAFDPQTLIAPVLAVLVVNLLAIGMIYIPAAKTAVPYVLGVGDLITAAALTFLVGEEPLLLILLVVAMSLLALLRFGWMWGIIEVVGIFGATAIMLGLIDSTVINRLDTFVPLLAASIGTVLSLIVWVYFRDEYARSQQQRLDEAVRQKESELNDVRERSKAISEMTATLSGMVSFDKILDATMDIGHMSVRKENKHRLVSMILLYRAGEESLYIANSRGLPLTDLARSVNGQQGLVGRTLDKCVPIVGKELSHDPELSGFIGLQGMRSSLCIPLRAGYDNYGVIVYASDATEAFKEERIDALMAIAAQTTIALQNAVLYQNLMSEKTRIIEMEENARKALVRDLHDVPTQTVAALVMKLRIIQKMYERKQPDFISEIKTAEEMAARATEEIRHVLFKLRPLALESQGLTPALHQLAEKVKKTYQQNVIVRVGKDLDAYLDKDAQGVIFYLIEEAVNNARKYAEAPLITVQVGRKGGVLLIRIVDNGKGFDMQGVNSGYDRRDSFGMVNMRERAELLDGTLKVDSAPGMGTTITVTIPIADRKNGKTSLAAADVDYRESKLAVVSAARGTQTTTAVSNTSYDYDEDDYSSY
jgi:signal transduction histidine kinase